MGTLNVLECLRQRPWIRAAVIITSDKCYQNVEWVWGYRETDPLGGDDPYSGSKGCAEIAARSYINSFLRSKGETNVATARAGNVIGGGDWAEDRIVPDCMRSWSEDQTVVIRNPNATRPWQHVLEPLSGYLWLGSQLLLANPEVNGEAYNFGPRDDVNHPVKTLIEALACHWPGAKWHADGKEDRMRREARLLKLSCDKALAHLQWKAVLLFDETVGFTSTWYRHFYESHGADMTALTSTQIEDYCRKATARGLAWSGSF